LNPTKDHFFIQSSTYENLVNLPDNYVESMGLTGSFFQQEIMGSFEAFEGLVYNFNGNREDPRGHVQEIPEAKKFKRIFGALDWGYTNPAVALVFGVDGDMRVWQLAEYYQRQIRLDDFLSEVLDLSMQYGVQSWWCDPAEPEHIDTFREKADMAMIPCEIHAADNAIVPGIQTVQRFLSVRNDGLPGLIVQPDCVATIAEFLSYQYDKKLNASDDAFVKEKPKPNQADHAMDACFIAGTLVETARGPVPIETVTTQDYVWTREGLQQVEFSGMVQKKAEVWCVEFSDGTKIYGTEDHPFFVNNNEWKKLRDLTPCDTMYTWIQHKYMLMESCLGRKLTTTILSLEDTRNQKDGLIECILPLMEQKGKTGLRGFTKKYGWLNTVKFQRIITSIIETATRLTMRSLTWKPLTNQRTLQCMANLGSLRKKEKNIWGLLDLLQKNGIPPKMVGNGIVSIQKMIAAWLGQSLRSVTNAGFLSQINLLGQLADFAQMPVSLGGEEDLVWMRKSGNVLSVEKNLPQISIPMLEPVVVHVVRVCNTKEKKAVYNLTVKKCPEYFAQGFLVHNCRYALHNEFGRSTATSVAFSALGQAKSQTALYAPIVEQLPKPRLVDEDGLPIEDIWWSTNDLYHDRVQRMAKLMNFLEGLQR
jgi:hypothetical protein